ncbi:Acriflavine sensitivity control protein acr-2 [Penicillium ucsense]|uniref:Acriflavine sensitivity control protein acr-2 n=2 Tax=Penicillium TaxID=5073 RepID=A0A8J8W6Y9_9EURO|nr:uncharacterized protein N7539_008844 [Penicillium diatomitis]KAF7718838.1 Acriflavine sensitivity control protein acr-2 [Penicillium ucsense]KAF7735083.1 Acriflavine sensitivity control protein acr-2 [Penicillium ucsense]KAJ5469226.1 hypothetical protein N7539_008844 [Penicillium diatomitis]
MNSVIDGPCYTCRNRRIQCDQSGVPCGKCRSAGLACLDKRPLKWVKGVAIRGKLQGHVYGTLDDPSPGKQNGRQGSAHQRRALRQVQSSGTILGDHSGPYSLRQAPVRTLAIPDPALSGLDDVSKYYLDYYKERICQLFIVRDTTRNPFRQLIALSLISPVLSKALLALAARHRANQCQTFHELTSPIPPEQVTADRRALVLKHQAIAALSRAVADPISSRQDSTLASVFLLVFLDLVESGSDGWNFHLEGAKNLVASLQPQSEPQAGINQGRGQTLHGILTFIAKQIKVIGTLGATFVRPRTLSGFVIPEHEEALLSETTDTSFLGCPDHILHVMHSLSIQRDILFSPTIDPLMVETHARRTHELVRTCEEFDCYAWVAQLQKVSSSARERGSLTLLARSFKVGTIIYGKRILDAMTAYTTQLVALVSELLDVLKDLQNDWAMFKCVLWPIFVAGLESSTQTERHIVQTLLEKFWNATSCLNAVNAAKTLQAYWFQADASGVGQSRWIFDIGQLGRDWLWI